MTGEDEASSAGPAASPARTTLGDLLAVLATLDPDGTIFASVPWSVQSRAQVIAGQVDDTAERDGLSYLLEVELAQQVAAVWSDWRSGRVPTLLELCRAVIHYAAHDAWQPVQPWSRREFIEVVDIMRSTRPTWFDLPPDRPPSPAEVVDVERELGCRLPADYVWFIERYGGGDFALARFRSMDPDSDLYVLAGHTSGSGNVVVSDDGTGLDFCFAVIDGVCPDRLLVVDTDDGSTRDLEMTFLEFVVREAFGEVSRP